MQDHPASVPLSHRSAKFRSQSATLSHSKSRETYIILLLLQPLRVLAQLVPLCPELIHLIRKTGQCAGLRLFVSAQGGEFLALSDGFDVGKGFSASGVVRKGKEGGRERRGRTGHCTLPETLRPALFRRTKPVFVPLHRSPPFSSQSSPSPTHKNERKKLTLGFVSSPPHSLQVLPQPCELSLLLLHLLRDSSTRSFRLVRLPLGMCDLCLYSC